MIQTGIIIATLVFKCLLPLSEAGFSLAKVMEICLLFSIYLKWVLFWTFQKIKPIKPFFFSALNFLAFSFCVCVCFIPMILFKTSWKTVKYMYCWEALLRGIMQCRLLCHYFSQNDLQFSGTHGVEFLGDKKTASVLFRNVCTNSPFK